MVQVLCFWVGGKRARYVETSDPSRRLLLNIIVLLSTLIKRSAVSFYDSPPLLVSRTRKKPIDQTYSYVHNSSQLEQAIDVIGKLTRGKMMTRQLDNRPFKKNNACNERQIVFDSFSNRPMHHDLFLRPRFRSDRVSQRARDSSRSVLSPTNLKIRASCENNGRLSSKHFGPSND